jgi:hypothetical protein
MTEQTPADRLTVADLANLPPVIDVPTAGRLLGISRTGAYQLAAVDDLPVPVIRVGHSLKVPTAPLLALLGITPQPAADPDSGPADRTPELGRADTDPGATAGPGAPDTGE